MNMLRLCLAGTFALALGATAAPSALAQIGAEVAIIRIAPPAPRVEVIPVRPGPYHVWQHGNWVWAPSGYVWHPGRWVLPPSGKTIWVAEEWVNFGGGWHLVPGHWRAVNEPPPAPAIERVAVVVDPPPPQVEVVPVVAAGHAWIHGHWSWDGVRYVWVPGHEMLAPIGYHVWEAGHWYKTEGRWFWANGYWR